MIYNNRIISRLDIKSSKVIKGIRYEGLKVIGDANELAIKYYHKGFDEIIMIDTVASLYGRNSLHNIISECTKNVFIPITVGGGIQTIDDAKNLLKCGADKVALNTSAINNPKIIKNLSDEIGSQSVVISIQAKKRKEGSWEAFCLNGREPTGVNVLEWIIKCQELGAGEIFLSSVDFDGCMNGVDLDLINEAKKITNIPLIVSSGIRDNNEIKKIFKNSIHAVAVGAATHANKIDIKKIHK